MYIAIEGPTAVGKTTLAVALSRQLPAVLSMDPFALNPFLSDQPESTSPIARCALLREATFLFLRILELRGTIMPACLAGRDVVGDWALWKQLVFGRLTLDEWEYRRLAVTYQLWEADLPSPDVCIVLTAQDPEVLKRRCDERGRGFESTYEVEYFSNLVKLFGTQMRHLRTFETRVIERDIEHFDSMDSDHIVTLIREITE